MGMAVGCQPKLQPIPNLSRSRFPKARKRDRGTEHQSPHIGVKHLRYAIDVTYPMPRGGVRSFPRSVRC